MLFYPLSNEKFSIILVEESYAVIASLIIIIAVLIFLGLHFREHRASKLGMLRDIATSWDEGQPATSEASSGAEKIKRR